MKMPINFIDELRALNSGQKTSEQIFLEKVLAILKKDRTTTESDDKLLPLYLKKLNHLLLSK